MKGDQENKGEGNQIQYSKKKCCLNHKRAERVDEVVRNQDTESLCSEDIECLNGDDQSGTFGNC